MSEERGAKVEAQTELERLRRDYAIAKSQLQVYREDLEELKSLVTGETIAATLITPIEEKSPDTSEMIATPPFIMPIGKKSPDTIDYSALGIRELKQKARLSKIRNYSYMTKTELIAELKKKG